MTHQEISALAAEMAPMVARMLAESDLASQVAAKINHARQVRADMEYLASLPPDERKKIQQAKKHQIKAQERSARHA